MKKYFIFATALAALASCSSDDFVGEQNLLENNSSGAISFNMGTTAVTRADKTGAGAAEDLNYQFIVYGEKDESSSNVSVIAGVNDTEHSIDRSGQLVFNNYIVNYVENTAYTSTSNTKDWEYVGLKLNDASATISTTDYTTNITPNSTAAAQTIKYWDYGAASYTFTAVSALPADIRAGDVKIAKTQSGTTVYDKGYTLTLTANAHPENIYIADRNPISRTNNSDRNTNNAYGGNVRFTFRNLLSHVRVGMYENVPGYSVTIDKFYYKNDGIPGTFDAMKEEGHTANSTGAFIANADNVGSSSAATLTVTYWNSDVAALENHPKISVGGAASPAHYITLGTNIPGTALGETAPTARFDQSTKDYTSFFPQEANAVPLKLMVDYTLTASITGETIHVNGATAEVPAQYLQWKPNYKYTYLFKISDNTNGHTGETGPEGLYPITFDAVEVIAEDGLAEYITTVSEPSITTFGAVYYTDNSDDSKSKYTAYQTGNNEYQEQTSPYRLDIFATFVESSNVKAPTVDGSGAQHVNVYKVTSSDDTNFPITEASVAEAIANPAMSIDIYSKENDTYKKVTDATTLTAGTTYYKSDGTYTPGTTGYNETVAVAGTDYKVGAKINVTNINSDASTYFSAAPTPVTTVPAEDGTTKTINALMLTGVKAGTYAIEYEASTAWTGTYKKVYKIIVVQ